MLANLPEDVVVIHIHFGMSGSFRTFVYPGKYGCCSQLLNFHCSVSDTGHMLKPKLLWKTKFQRYHDAKLSLRYAQAVKPNLAGHFHFLPVGGPGLQPYFVHLITR